MIRPLSRRQILALILALSLASLLLLSTLFVVIHARHTCSGEHCKICHEIAFCLIVIQHLTVPAAEIHITAGLLCLLLLSVPIGIVIRRRPDTLVLLKIRLDD